jgi:hypothetical protein
MDEINNNLKKLQSEVMQINDLFKKESKIQIDYIKYLNLTYIRISAIFVILFIILYGLKLDFCHEEIVNEETFFKEKKIKYNYLFFMSLFGALGFYYFTRDIVL